MLSNQDAIEEKAEGCPVGEVKVLVWWTTSATQLMSLLAAAQQLVRRRFRLVPPHTHSFSAVLGWSH